VFVCPPASKIDAHQISEKRDLNNLCRVSKLFHKLATPLLYESLVIKCPEGFNPRFSILKRFSKTRPQIEFTSSIRYVKNLILTTKFEDLTGHGGRCWHHRYDDKEDEEEEGASRPNLPENCKYNSATFGRSTEEDEEDNSNEDDTHSECNCELCIDEPGDPDFYEDHFRVFCLGLSENALKSFR
jgi:hypothetical protein